MKFYLCETCGNLIAMVNDSGVNPVCCGSPMKELIPGEVDAAFEKHVPVYEVQGTEVSVKVGEVEHPMVDEHFIQWIAVETNKGCHLKYLKPGEKPEANFAITDDESVVAVYEYCSVHGLWKK